MRTAAATPAAAPGGVPIRERVDTLDWPALAESLARWGHARTAPVLTPEECAALAALYLDDARFRSRVHMERYRFGVGDYAYFAHPLPPLVRALREALYARLAPVANRWAEALGEAFRYPPTLRAYL
ncbi:MAG TPA: 2OG-Fe(II) oxygenase, partial [bacterium]